MQAKKQCRECRDGEIDAEAQFKVKGMRELDTGRKVPYAGHVCESHLESIQTDDTELTQIERIKEGAE